MAEEFEEVKNALEKILKAIQKDRNFTITYREKTYKKYGRANTLSVGNLNITAGNHLFDDYPDRFGITKEEGHRVRAYFKNSWENTRWGDHVIELHEAFPDIIESEEKWWIDQINKRRKRLGLIIIPYY